MNCRQSQMTDIFGVLKVLDDLKHLKRAGWVRFNIPEPETVACHMYRMAMLAMLLDDDNDNDDDSNHDNVGRYDRARCIRMALIHDLGEAIVGDITPQCGIPVDEKHRLENEAMKKITQMVPPTVGSDWYSLWCEYEEGKTKEAVIVKQLDKFDMLAQAFHYEQKYGIDLEEFFSSTKGIFTLEPFISWDNELRTQRSVRKFAEEGSKNASSMNGTL